MHYLILFGLFAAAVICSISTGNLINQGFLNGLSTSLISEFLGAALIAIFVERYIRNKEKLQKDQAKKLAFNKLSIPLISIFENLLKLVDRQFPGVIDFELNSLGEVFNDRYFQSLKICNMKTLSDQISPLNWAHHLGNTFTGFQVSVEKTIDIYGRYLEIEELEKIEKVFSDRILTTLSGMNSIVNSPAPIDLAKFFSILNILPLVQTFIFNCIEVSELINSTQTIPVISPSLLKKRVRPSFEDFQRLFERAV